MDTHDNRIARLALDVHAEQAAEREAETARQEAEIRARERGPEELGLVRCPHCDWWRDPIPETATRSPRTFRIHLDRVRAFCMCTASRCHRCGEPMLDRCPTPRYYSETRRIIVNCSGMTTGLAHATRCSKRDA